MTTEEQKLNLAMRLECPWQAKELVQPILDAAIAMGDVRLEALALSGMAEVDSLLCNHRESQVHATRAAQLWQVLGDLRRESNVLLILARTSSALGRNETAVEASLLALELAKRAQDLGRVTQALTQLGHTLTHSRDFDGAAAALAEAEELARGCGFALDELVALARQGACEALRFVALRHETGELPSLAHLDALLEKFAQFKATHDMAALAEPDQMPIQVFLGLVEGLFRCWRGELTESQNVLKTTRLWLDSTGVAPWMETFEALVRCELAFAFRDWENAELQTRRMLEQADATGNEQSAMLGHILQSRVFELKGDQASALLELKVMAARERRIRAESLSTRHAVVTWQLDMRRSEASRRDLQASADRLTKLSLEDPLTGIANRRCFEAEATSALQGGADGTKAVCIALLDVDQFKQVNDVHGHGVGDKVLQVISALLTEHVRQEDLAARLAGDEFVVLFRHIDARQATEICERLRTAVCRYAWHELSPCLDVSVSVGVAQSEAGDSLETLIHRSDQSMYRHKNVARRPA